MSRTASERGSTLLLAIFVIALLSSLGIALLFLTQTGSRMGQSDVRSKQAFYLAEAAIEDARMSLLAVHGGQPFDAALATAAADGTFDFDPEALAVVFDVDGSPTALAGFGNDQPVRDLTPLGSTEGTLGTYAAFLTNDPTEAGDSDSNDRVMITGIGFALDRSVEVAQAIVEHRFLFPVIPTAAITLLGPDPTFNGGSSAAKVYVGDDCDGTGDPSIRVATVGLIGAAAEADVDAVVGTSNRYRSGTYRGRDTVIDLTDPTEPLAGVLDPTWTDCLALRDMMAQVRTAADVICTNPGCPLPPSAPDRVVFVEGNYTAGDGEGLLAVTRQLNVNGNWSWSGLVLVIGTGDMQRNGGGSGEIMGGIIVANIAGPDQTLFTADDCTEAPDGFGPAAFVTAGAGSSTVSYCQSALDAVRVPLPYRIVDFRQR